MKWTDHYETEDLIHFLEGSRSLLKKRRKELELLEQEIKARTETILEIRKELNKRGIE